MDPFEVLWEVGPTRLTTRIRSPMRVDDVTGFRNALERALAALVDVPTFEWLSGAVGYDALENRAAHEQLRSIVPLTLAAHGFRTSLLDLYEDAKVCIAAAPAVRCRAIAHVHGDREKMQALDEHLGRARERYFGDEPSALAWLTALAEAEAGPPAP